MQKTTKKTRCDNNASATRVQWFIVSVSVPASSSVFSELLEFTDTFRLINCTRTPADYIKVPAN